MKKSILEKELKKQSKEKELNKKLKETKSNEKALNKKLKENQSNEKALNKKLKENQSKKELKKKLEQSKKNKKNSKKYLKEINIIDLDGNRIDTNKMEIREQILVNKYVKKNDIVLELGARYGSVSCRINYKLNNKYNQVVVEPDSRVWEALEKNKKNNNCDFTIVKGFISNKKLDLINLDGTWNGYASTYIENDNTKIPSYTLEEIMLKYIKKFNVLVADCEGCLELFFDENPDFYDNLRLIIFEEDYPNKCNYNKIKNKLIEKKFNKIVEGHQNVWIKSTL
jgi:FkbM family methyltransferase